jgi:hypothetical protein
VIDEVDARLTDQLWIPLAEAARRQVPSVSRAAMHKRVSKLVEAGRLNTKPGPRGTVLVNIVALNRAIESETDPSQALRNAAPEPVEPNVTEDDAGGDTAPAAPSGGSTYHASRASREAYQAENARLDLEERLQRLTDKDDVGRRTMTVMRKTRDRLLGLPAKVAERLASAPDARAIRTILTSEIRGLLEGLATELETLEDDDDESDIGEPTADQD